MKSKVILLAFAALGAAWSGSACDPNCSTTYWYQDADHDGMGASGVSQTGCSRPDGYVDNSIDPDDSGNGFTLTSAAVVNGLLQSAYKCETKVSDIESSIPLAWTNPPAGTGSFAIVMYHYPNPDNTTQAPNTYLMLWDVPSTVTEIAHGGADDGTWYMGPNKDKTAISYTSPCSPSAGTHIYTIDIYALASTPASFPTMNDISMSWDTFQAAVGSVQKMGETKLQFSDVN